MGDLTKFQTFAQRYNDANKFLTTISDAECRALAERETRDQRVARLERCGMHHSLLDGDFAAVRDMQVENSDALASVDAWWGDPNALPWLCLAGGTGRGKTMALADLAARHTARYTTAEELSRVWGANYGPQYDEQLAARNCSLLLIDDVGTELDNRLMTAALLSLLSRRGRKSETQTVITTNFAASTFAGTYKNDRILSRLNTHVQWVALTGADRRKNKPKPK